MPSLTSIMRELETPDSDYVNAAKNGDIETIKAGLNDAAKPKTNEEHAIALSEAVYADNLEIVQLICAKANETAKVSIDPFHCPKETQNIINNALRVATYPIIKLLLQQKKVQEYLQTPTDESKYTLENLLNHFVRKGESNRAACELIRVAKRNPDQSKIIPKELSENFLSEQLKMENSYRLLTFSVHNGLTLQRSPKITTIHKTTSKNTTKLVKKVKNAKPLQLPSLPLPIIQLIYSFAINPKDLDINVLATLPRTTLKWKKPKPKA